MVTMMKFLKISKYIIISENLNRSYFSIHECICNSPSSRVQCDL